ncbi:DctP family TRAP transporter solute-binding subunit [Alteribacillus iranensis]|uniref:Tripartite ATP-independent transporter solute receptor, DctP family n=1 Tax=Alteribacillus iranensis TaxID=930128 RepID=A0A1I2ERK7_9BACI|nr:DctP family TRAP transporter solute-binding subunit [Alteribacillus iranensis]SFE94951.1 tripartite ATP-independent transporter solute receptor, DctP family [Alteribacillus iranensis]
MKKRKFGLLGSTALVTSMLLAACGGGGGDNGGESADGGEAGEETYNWRFITEEYDGQVQFDYAEEFASRLEEKSDGQINIDVYEFGGLGSEIDQVEQLQSGAVEMAIVSPGFTGTMVDEAQIFSLQYLLPSDQEQVHELLNTSEAINEDLAALYEENNIKPLSFFTEGFTNWTANKELSEPSHFEGVKFRTQDSPLNQMSYETYGADPTVMSAGDLYSALQQGTVDAQENPIFFIADSSYHEVQDYLMISNHNSYVAMMTVNPTFYNDLPDDIKAMFDETVEEMRDVGFQIQDDLNSEYIEVIEEDTDNPTEVVELTEEQRDAFRELQEPLRDYYRENGGEQAGEILDKLTSEIEEITGE